VRQASHRLVKGDVGVTVRTVVTDDGDGGPHGCLRPLPKSATRLRCCLDHIFSDWVPASSRTSPSVMTCPRS
jgi:hypothetical protein